MLTLTDNATNVIRTLGESPELPDGAGLRIAATADGSQGLTLAAATQPRDGDQVVEQDGARVFLEPDAAQVLDDKVLDARVDDDGGVQFMVAQQQ